MRVNGEDYLYRKNLQGDITGIYNPIGNLAVEYTYDAWGKLIDTTGFLSGTVGEYNSLRYRGYYYDSDTGLYYLNSRYYDPETGRYINADGYNSTGQGIAGYNMFAYCGYNPINRNDPNGQFWSEIGQFFSDVWNGITSWFSDTFGAGSSTTTTIAQIETPIIPDPSPITAVTGTTTTKIVSKHGDSTKPISVYANRDAENPVKSSAAGIKINISSFTLNLSLGFDNIGLYSSITDGNVTDSFGLRINLSELKVGFESSTAIQWDDVTQTGYTNVSASGWAVIAAIMLVSNGQSMPSPSQAYGY